MSTTSWDDLTQVFNFAADIIQKPDTPDWVPANFQKPPPLPWFIWMMMGGRGSGKTAAAAKYVHDHIHGPPCIPNLPGGHWISIVAPTLGDAVTSCVNGPSGLRQWEPNLKVTNEVGGAVVKWPNGAVAKLFGAHRPEDVERFRAGGNRCLCWAEELAAWRMLQDAWDQIKYGLRSGPRPHIIVSTTPKPRPLIKALINDPLCAVTRGSTKDNPHLPEHIRDQLYNDYGGTRMGRQELEGEYLDDVVGSLWTPEMVDPFRCTMADVPLILDRMVVGVDPQIKANQKSSETGIIVAGMVRRWGRSDILFPHLPHAFIFEDHSRHYTSRGWAEKVSIIFHENDCDRVVAETNNGGDLVVSNIHTVDNSVPVKQVHASRGKTARAEPVVSMYEQGRVHHVGYFSTLEDQMYTWNAEDPAINDFSPDRMDALVWALWELLIGRSMVRKNRMKDKRLAGRR